MTLSVKEEHPATLGIEDGAALLQVGLWKRNCVNILDILDNNDSELTSSAIFDEFL